MTGPEFPWEAQLGEDDQRWADIAQRLTTDRFAPLAAEIDRDQRYPRESIRPMVERPALLACSSLSSTAAAAAR